MIAERKKETPKERVAVQVDELSLSTSTIVDIDTPIAKMKEYTNGSNWDGITYYKQIKGEDDVITPLDVNSHTTMQQYDKIDGYRLKLTSPLSKEESGEATVLHFRPQKHDMFKAQLINGDYGLFIVNEVTVMNFNNQDAFDISFTIYSRNNNDPAIFKNIEEKVVKTIFFDKDSNYLNSSPLLLPSEWNYALWLKKTIDDLKRFYIHSFKDRRSAMLVYGNRISVDTVTLFLSMCDLREKAYIDIVVPGCLDNVAEPLLLAIRYKDISYLESTEICCYNTHPNPMYSTLVYEGLEIRDSSLFGLMFKKGNPQTDLERFVYKYITNNDVDESLFKKVVDEIKKEDKVISYMVIPLLILIANEELRVNTSDLRRR